MDDNHQYSLSPPLPNVAIGDRVGLLSSQQPPGTSTVTAATQPASHYRGRHSRGNSRDDRLRHIDENESAHYGAYDLAEPPTPSKTRRRLSAGPSSASSMLRRLTTKYSPMSRSNFQSSKRSQGRRYATLEDDEAAPVGNVDLSSLEGMGWEMTDMSNSDTARLQDDDTAYAGPSAVRGKPDFRSFVHGRSVGEGMRDIGVQLRRDPTKVVRRSTGGPRNAESTGIDRVKTVREFGQNLAQEKKMIVEIEEAVDLSSLEGGQPDNRASRAFETMSMRQSIMPQETKSYFFPKDPDIPNWKPMSVSSVYILFLMAVALALAGIQEYLCERSIHLAHEHSGLLSFNHVAEISTWDFFAWKCKFRSAGGT